MICTYVSSRLCLPPNNTADSCNWLPCPSPWKSRYLQHSIKQRTSWPEYISPETHAVHMRQTTSSIKVCASPLKTNVPPSPERRADGKFEKRQIGARWEGPEIYFAPARAAITRKQHKDWKPERKPNQRCPRRDKWRWTSQDTSQNRTNEQDQENWPVLTDQYL